MKNFKVYINAIIFNIMYSLYFSLNLIAKYFIFCWSIYHDATMHYDIYITFSNSIYIFNITIIINLILCLMININIFQKKIKKNKINTFNYIMIASLLFVIPLFIVTLIFIWRY